MKFPPGSRIARGGAGLDLTPHPQPVPAELRGAACLKAQILKSLVARLCWHALLAFPGHGLHQRSQPSVRTCADSNSGHASGHHQPCFLHEPSSRLEEREKSRVCEWERKGTSGPAQGSEQIELSNPITCQEPQSLNWSIKAL